MARIAGVDIPNEKRIVISLQYIYGIGETTSKNILKAANVSEDIRTKDLTEEQLGAIRQEVAKFKVEGDLDPLPTLLQLFNEQSENYSKWEKTKNAHEIMKTIIKLGINKLPFLKGYFYLLDMITFAIYYLASIKSLSSFPDTNL